MRIKDTGPGVADTKHIFSPTFSTKAGGGGMGLPVSRQIARLHGGHLVAQRPEDGGAELVLTLPASDSPPSDDSIATKETEI